MATTNIRFKSSSIYSETNFELDWRRRLVKKKKKTSSVKKWSLLS